MKNKLEEKLNFSKFLVKGLKNVLLFAYAFPTLRRINYETAHPESGKIDDFGVYEPYQESSLDPLSEEFSRRRGMNLPTSITMGTFFGATIHTPLFIGASRLFNFNPNIYEALGLLGIPLATNIFSGWYERRRENKNRRLVESGRKELEEMENLK